MKFTQKDIMQTLKVVILALLLVVGTNYIFAVDWSPPTQSPPGGNTAAPLNTTDVGQTKLGGLILNTGNAANGLVVTNGNLIVQSPTGKVGIGTGTLAPTRTLHVNGDFRLTKGFYDSANLPGTAGQVLASKGASDGVKWTTLTGGGGGGISGGGTSGRIAKFSGATVIDDSIITQTAGLRIGIDTGATPITAKLDINGNIRIRGEGTSLPAAGRVLTSDADGVGTWQTPAAAAGVEIKSSSGTSICGLTANKAFMVTVYGTLTSHSNVSTYTTSVTVNGAVASILISNHPDGSAPISMSLRAVSTNVAGNGCLTATPAEFQISGMAAIG